jgi:hypothetical protein
MADELKKEGAIDQTKFVPKEEHEKAEKTYKGEIETLKSQLEQANMSLLDPDFIQYKESKQSKNLKAEAGKLADKLKDGSLTPEAITAIEERINRISLAVENLLAVQELNGVKDKYSDFESFRDKTKAILESSSTPLTIEQAYLLAKAQEIKIEKTPEEKFRSARSGTEKPGSGIAGEGTEPAKFKDKVSAADDAWDKVIGGGKGSL